MGIRKDKNNFHTTYDDRTMENMKRYYRIDTDDELVQYIKKNVEFDEDDVMHNSKSNKKLEL
jgi:hypothetical protein